MLRGMESTLDIHTQQLEKILNAIKETKCTLEAKIDTVALDVGLLRADHKKLSEKSLRSRVHQLSNENISSAITERSQGYVGGYNGVAAQSRGSGGALSSKQRTVRGIPGGRRGL